MDCTGCRYYHNLADNHCLVCDGSGYTRPSNADQLRLRTDEELAQFLYNCGALPPNCNKKDIGRDYKSCKDCWLDWLQQEVQE